MAEEEISIKVMQEISETKGLHIVKEEVEEVDSKTTIKTLTHLNHDQKHLLLQKDNQSSLNLIIFDSLMFNHKVKYIFTK